MEDLTTENPFFDVVFTGHSFGAGLATIGAMRYAVLQPMIRVSCNAFGSPRVGGTEFRSLVHSLPNLKVIYTKPAVLHHFVFFTTTDSMNIFYFFIDFH